MGNTICILDKKELEVEKLLCCQRQRCRNQGRVESHCPRLQALPAGMCHTRSKVSSQGYRTHLPGWQGSYSNAGFPWEQANWHWQHLALLTIKHLLHSPCAASQAELTTVNACSLRNNERRQELRLSQEVRIPSAAKECPVMWFRLRGWELGWRCVGPRSGDTIAAMSSCILIPEPVRAWRDWGHQSRVSSVRLLFLHPRVCTAFFCQTDNGVLASC